MIDDRFSAANFARFGPNSQVATRLADDLRAEILAEVQEVALGAFRNAIDRLRSLGHQLDEEPERPTTIPGVAKFAYGPPRTLETRDWLGLSVDIMVIAISGWEVSLDSKSGIVVTGVDNKPDGMLF